MRKIIETIKNKIIQTKQTLKFAFTYKIDFYKYIILTIVSFLLFAVISFYVCLYGYLIQKQIIEAQGRVPERDLFDSLNSKVEKYVIERQDKKITDFVGVLFLGAVALITIYYLLRTGAVHNLYEYLINKKDSGDGGSVAIAEGETLDQIVRRKYDIRFQPDSFDSEAEREAYYAWSLGPENDPVLRAGFTREPIVVEPEVEVPVEAEVKVEIELSAMQAKMEEIVVTKEVKVERAVGIREAVSNRPLRIGEADRSVVASAPRNSALEAPAEPVVVRNENPFPSLRSSSNVASAPRNSALEAPAEPVVVRNENPFPSLRSSSNVASAPRNSALEAPAEPVVVRNENPFPSLRNSNNNSSSIVQETSTNNVNAIISNNNNDINEPKTHTSTSLPISNPEMSNTTTRSTVTTVIEEGTALVGTASAVAAVQVRPLNPFITGMTPILENLTEAQPIGRRYARSLTFSQFGLSRFENMVPVDTEQLAKLEKIYRNEFDLGESTEWYRRMCPEIQIYISEHLSSSSTGDFYITHEGEVSSETNLMDKLSQMLKHEFQEQFNGDLSFLEHITLEEFKLLFERYNNTVLGYDFSQYSHLHDPGTVDD